MSSYEEFLEEAEMLSTVTDSPEEEIPIPITVPHSRPRGTWGQWMKEFTIPPEVLDNIVRRYDSKSWSATGGRSSESVSRSDEGASSSTTVPSWSNVTAGPRARDDHGSKEGGATSSMRGVTRSRPRSVSSGRARALLQRPETPQESSRRPGEIGRLSSVNESPTSPESRQPPVRPPRQRQAPPPGFSSPSPLSNWPPVEVSDRLEQASADLNDGRGVKARGNVWEQRALENGRESGQDQVTEQEDPDVIVEGENLSDKSSCFFSAHDSREEEEEEEILGVFFTRRDETVRDGSQVGGEVDLIIWEDDEHERGKEVVSDDRNEYPECGDGPLPLPAPTLASHTGRETTDSCWVGDSGGSVRRLYKEDEEVWEKEGERGEGDGKEERRENEEEEEEEVVKMKCGCTLDQLEAHMGWGFQCPWCGGSADPKLPPWANDDHTLVLNNIPTSVSEEDLEEDIQAFGEVSNCSILTLPNEAGLHTAYVRMKERESCQWVISCYQGIPYGNGASKPMVCYTLQQQEPSLGF